MFSTKYTDLQRFSSSRDNNTEKLIKNFMVLRHRSLNKVYTRLRSSADRKLNNNKELYWKKLQKNKQTKIKIQRIFLLTFNPLGYNPGSSYNRLTIPIFYQEETLCKENKENIVSYNAWVWLTTRFSKITSETGT